MGVDNSKRTCWPQWEPAISATGSEGTSCSGDVGIDVGDFFPVGDAGPGVGDLSFPFGDFGSGVGDCAFLKKELIVADGYAMVVRSVHSATTCRGLAKVDDACSGVFGCQRRHQYLYIPREFLVTYPVYPSSIKVSSDA